MRKFLLSLYIILIPSPVVAVEACTCYPYPFVPDPPCNDVCYTRFIERANISELRDILMLPDEMVSKITRAQAENAVSDDLIKKFSEQLLILDDDSIGDLLYYNDDVISDFGPRVNFKSAPDVASSPITPNITSKFEIPTATVSTPYDGEISTSAEEFTYETEKLDEAHKFVYPTTATSPQYDLEFQKNVDGLINESGEIGVYPESFDFPAH